MCYLFYTYSFEYFYLFIREASFVILPYRGRTVVLPGLFMVAPNFLIRRPQPSENVLLPSRQTTFKWPFSSQQQAHTESEFASTRLNLSILACYDRRAYFITTAQPSYHQGFPRNFALFPRPSVTQAVQPSAVASVGKSIPFLRIHIKYRHNGRSYRGWGRALPAEPCCRVRRRRLLGHWYVDNK